MRLNGLVRRQDRASGSERKATQPVRKKRTVVVIGGGITAILCLRELLRAGFDAWAIVGARVGGEQTLACQRYLHSGSFYTNPELIQLLLRTRGYWDILRRETGLEVVTGHSYVAFGNENEAAPRVRLWREMGLKYSPVPPTRSPFHSPILRQFYRVNDERWLAQSNPSLVLASGLEGRLLSGAVTHLLSTRAGGFRVVYSAGKSRTFDVVPADSVVLAAGAGNEKLIQQVSEAGTPRQQERACQVLELTGTLPFASLLCPVAGHFIVPTSTDGNRTTWRCTFEADPKVETDEPPLDTSRYDRQEASLAEMLPFVFAQPVTRRIAVVQKAESWELGRGQRPDGYFVGEVVPGALAIWPTKLTLAPLAAEQVVAAVRRYVGR